MLEILKSSCKEWSKSPDDLKTSRDIGLVSKKQINSPKLYDIQQTKEQRASIVGKTSFR